MAQAVETIIEIDGRKIKDFISLKLSQSIYAHHEFRLECFAEALGGNMEAVFNASTDLIGAPVHIQVTSAAEQSRLSFSGIVTQVAAASSNGHSGNIIITGASPTVLLDQGPQHRSWLRKSVRSMISDVLKSFPVDWLKYKIDATYKETIPYEVQYNETAWQFINRLAGRFGEWLYYDGEKLVLGPSRDPTVDLIYGVQLSRFIKGIELKPGKLQGKVYDYVNNKIHESLIENFAGKEGHDELGAKALAKSEQVFGAHATYWHNQNLKDKKQLDRVMNIQAAIQCSDVIRMTACTDWPGLRPADKIRVKKEDAVNEYRIISIEHCWDGIGNYTNEFVSIPASVEKAPVKPVKAPHCATQSAIVVNNYDEAQLGRVQVKFHWMREGDRSKFIRMVSPYTGDGNGLFMMPEIGSEVKVDFANGDATDPYIIGVVNNGNAKTKFSKAGNDIKAILTRSGIKIIMDDHDGSVLLEDKNGNGVNMDGDGTITIKSKDKMVLASGESKIVLNKDGTIEISGRKVEIDTTEDVRLTSNANVKINAATMVAVEGAKITLN
jgi:type VI secretion system secreted protein VgrG